MGLLSIFKRRTDSSSKPAAVSEPADAVQRARTRARQRLIGAAVLVGIGIVGFPLVFETQPRPISVDIPIEVPRKEGVAPLVMPAVRAPATKSDASAVQTPPAAAPSDVITESREYAGRELAASQPAASAPAAAATVASRPVAAAAIASKPAAKPALAAAVEPAAKPANEAKPAVPVNDTARAKALLEGKPTAAAESGRFVVQVGAFADVSAARETRLKAEKLGLKTYTQVVSTSAGSRIRVRVGPFTTHDEADKALAKARSAGLTAVVLTL